ncbi:O-antigen ligase family protein [Candidatus Poribacteria bacterium]|nr:O-antigen ligase family protein [Candidatus Poribacteria bacterium]
MREDTQEGGTARLAGLVGAGVFVALALVVPLLCAPPSLFSFPTVTPGVKYIKDVALRFLCAIVFLAATVKLHAGGWRGFRRAQLPAMLAGASLGAGVLSAVFSEEWRFAAKSFLSEGSLLLAAALAPAFLTTARRVRFVLAGALVSGVAVAFIALVSSRGYGGFNEFIYGADPLKILEAGRERTMGTIQGGFQRGATISTVGNPEYTGHYAAIAFLLAGCWVLDGFGSVRARHWAAWLAGAAAMGVTAGGVLATGTRGAWIVIAAGMTARWLCGMRLRGTVIAGWLLACLAAGQLMGIPAGAVVFLLGLLAVLAWQIANGCLKARWLAIPLRSRVLMVAGPMLVLLAVGVLAVRRGPAALKGVLIERVGEGLSTNDNSVRERLVFYMIAGEETLRNPVWGVGPGFYAPNYYPSLASLVETDASGALEYARITMGNWFAENAHNDYFQIGAERGLIGLALFLALLSATFTGLARTGRGGQDAAPALACCTALAGFCAMMLTSFPLHEGGRLSVFYAIVSCSIGLIAMGGVNASTDEAIAASGTTDASAGAVPPRGIRASA